MFVNNLGCVQINATDYFLSEPLCQSIFFTIASGKNTSTQSKHRYSTSPPKDHFAIKKVSPESEEKFCFCKTKVFLYANLT